MAALMQSTNEPVVVSNPITGPSHSITSSDPISFLKPPSKPESNLSSIASAGLHVSRSQPPQMTSPSSAPDRPVEHDRDSERNNSQVAREALGASEKSPVPSIQDPQIHASPEQIQVDAHSSNDTPDPYGSADHQHSLMHASTVASPGPIEESASQDGDRHRQREDSEIDQDSHKAFSYPMPTGGLNDPRRGLSLPNAGYNRNSPRSPSAKKHRCPYCATEFTRQHNLKSHLLTHSQEKPFVCQTCQSRFRRLHDLKRHTKLHTGERPHLP
ncbi:Zinc finger C2H2 [Penicillium verhagenii]|nr:Zinc finger C2H2 [Penicillium verhagenii]